MSFRRSLLAITAPALLVVGGCTTAFKADVSRFQALPAPQGQTFVVMSSDPQLQGGLEFQQYAGLVTQRLSQQGYQLAASTRDATLVVMLDYGVDSGQEKIVTTPGFGGYGGFGYGGWGRFGGWGPGWGYGGFGRGFRSSFYYGWNDPFWWGPWDYPDVRSYTYYTSFLDMKISRAADGQRLFEGRAKARSMDSKLTTLVPNLVEAMFTGFPGRSGEEIRITVPPPPRTSAAR